MPPRFAYWTILAGGLPTSFRAGDKDELMPTFRRLKEKHPDAEMKYFARGKLWESPEDARNARTREQPRTERRTREWRPGGDHKDPRQRFAQARKNRTARRPPQYKPHGDKLRHGIERGEEQPGRPPHPDREPPPGHEQEPGPPPRPSEPAIKPPGPPERGRGPSNQRNRYKPRGRR